MSFLLRGWVAHTGRKAEPPETSSPTNSRDTNISTNNFTNISIPGTIKRLSRTCQNSVQVLKAPQAMWSSLSCLRSNSIGTQTPKIKARTQVCSFSRAEEKFSLFLSGLLWRGSLVLRRKPVWCDRQGGAAEGGDDDLEEIDGGGDDSINTRWKSWGRNWRVNTRQSPDLRCLVHNIIY